MVETLAYHSPINSKVFRIEILNLNVNIEVFLFNHFLN
jgi:hypothetical protein